MNRIRLLTALTLSTLTLTAISCCPTESIDATVADPLITPLLYEYMIYNAADPDKTDLEKEVDARSAEMAIALLEAATAPTTKPALPFP